MAMDDMRPYHVRASGRAPGPVEAWPGYRLQLAGQRRSGWQDEMAAGLRDTLAGLRSPGRRAMRYAPVYGQVAV